MTLQRSVNEQRFEVGLLSPAAGAPLLAKRHTAPPRPLPVFEVMRTFPPEASSVRLQNRAHGASVLLQPTRREVLPTSVAQQDATPEAFSAQARTHRRTSSRASPASEVMRTFSPEASSTLAQNRANGASAVLQPKRREMSPTSADQQANTPEAFSAQTQTHGTTNSQGLPRRSPKFVPTRQTTVEEPDIEPSPSRVLVTKVDGHGALQEPLLEGSTVREPYTTGPRVCLRVIILLPIWGAAALLGLSVSCMAQALHAMHAATKARPQSPLDFTLRLAVAPDKCLGSTAIQPQSLVVLQTCSAKETQQFLLLKDGTIRSRSDVRFCVTSTHTNKLALMMCSQSDMQVFDVQPSGKLALKAKPSECLNLLGGDLSAGVVGTYSCGGDLNEVFVYGGGHLLVPILEAELHKVMSLPPKAAEAGQLQQNLKAICGLTVLAFMLSTFLLMVARPNRKYMLLHCLALGFIACMIVLVCSCLLFARTAIQDTERVMEKAKSVASAQTADVDFTLRMTKAANLCLGAESLDDKAKVSLQQCKASTTQQFILKEDGTIRTKNADGLCLTVQPQSKNVALSPCSADKSRGQIFSKDAEVHGWLQPQALPSLCLNLLGGDEKAGAVGLYKCSSDLNEVFIYSGGNVAISSLALQIHQVRHLLQQGSHTLEKDFAGIFSVGGVACFLLLVVPSILLLPGLATQPST